MSHAGFSLAVGVRAIVGGFGNPDDLRTATPESVATACDVVEIRLDLIAGAGKTRAGTLWRQLSHLPLLFTARRGDEGGHGALDATSRGALLENAMEHAALIDVEVASIPECAPVLDSARQRGVPWIASFHDFSGLPQTSVLEEALRLARESGAAAFKAAAWLHSPDELARLAGFQLADHGLPVATMGMGPLAAVSRLLCAQCGSVLNYGYLGECPTAPGQWPAGFLKEAISRLTPVTR